MLLYTSNFFLKKYVINLLLLTLLPYSLSFSEEKAKIVLNSSLSPLDRDHALCGMLLMMIVDRL